MLQDFEDRLVTCSLCNLSMTTTATATENENYNNKKTYRFPKGALNPRKAKTLETKPYSHNYEIKIYFTEHNDESKTVEE